MDSIKNGYDTNENETSSDRTQTDSINLYKIESVCGVVKCKTVEHLDKNGLISNFQARFTEDRRLEENLSIVRYCINEIYTACL